MEAFPLLETEGIVIFLLAIIAIVTWLGNQIPTPYTVAIVITGLLLTLLPGFLVEVPEGLYRLILPLFLPPVVFEAAFQIKMRVLRENAVFIGVLTTIGVLLSTIVVAVIVGSLSSEVALMTAVIFGALISAIDPVAVIALFKATPVSHRLENLVESESLLNDGTAIVIFSITLTAAQTGSFNIAQGLLDFVIVSAGGLLIGAVLGWIFARIIKQVDDYLVEATFTICLAFGSYLLAEQFHVSGVLAAVMAGLTHGQIGLNGMSARTQEVVKDFWEIIAYFANGAIFLLIGFTSELNDLLAHLPLIGIAIVAVLISRAVLVYGITPLLNQLTPEKRRIPLSWQHILFWGGQRGAVSLALALSLPLTLSNRDSIQFMTFGVVLFTTLVQATSMPWVVHHFKLPDKESASGEAGQAQQQD